MNRIIEILERELPLSKVFLLLIAAVASLAILRFGKIAFFGTIGFFFFLFILNKPHIGLLLIPAAIPLGVAGTLTPATAPFVVSVIRILGGFTALAWAVYVARTKRALVHVPQNIPVLLFIIVAFFSIFYAPYRPGAISNFMIFLSLTVFYFLVVNMVNSPRMLRLFVWMIALSAGGLALFGILQWAYFVVRLRALGVAGIIRASATAGDANWFALMETVALPFTLYLFWSERKAKNLFTLLLASQLAAIVFSYSRMAFLGLSVMFLLLVLKGRMKVPVALPTVLLVFSFLPIFGGRYWDRVVTIFQPGAWEQDFAINVRFIFQRAAIKIFLDNPLLGAGTGNYGIAMERYPEYQELLDVLYRERPFSRPHLALFGAHNMYLDIAAELGLLGLLPLLWLITLTLKDLRNFQRIFKSRNDPFAQNVCEAMEIGLWIFLVCGIFLHAAERKYLWIIIALTAAIKGMMRRRAPFFTS